MAMIAQAVLLSLSVQSLLATTDTSTTVNGSLSTSPASTKGASEMTSPSSTDQTDVDNQTMPTQVSTTLVRTNSTGLTETSATTTELPTETVSTVTMVPTLSTVTPTSESQTSTQSQTTKGVDGGTTTILSGTTSSMSSTTQMMTSGLTGDMTTSRGTKEAPGPERVSLAVYIAIGVVGGLFVIVVIFALSVWCLRRGKSRRRRGARNPFAQDEMDKLDPKERMSMHRPDSATVNAEGDLAFVTFITGAASPDSHVDGIENPTYALGPNGDAGEPTEKTAGAGAQSNTATLPSQVQLSNEGPTDGADHDDKKYADSKGASLRPQSGVSYTSNDIEGALETIDSM